MNVIAYYPIHYGAEYLKESILSINDVVKKIIFLYSDTPTYGHTGNLQNPDSEELLKSIVFENTNKAEWVNIQAGTEGEHRDLINNYNKGFDLTLAVDADEVWNTESLETALKEAYALPYKRYGIDGFINFFRDLNHVCYDGFRPIRIYKENGKGEYVNLKGTIYHFGYAQSEAILRYKFSVHGHADELRPNWIDEVYLSDKTEDLHPVAIGLWNLVPYDKNTLPELLKKHPNFNL